MVERRKRFASRTASVRAGAETTLASGWVSVGGESRLDLEWKCRWKTLKRGELARGAGCGEDATVDDLGEEDEVGSGVAMNRMS
jgi:hypothetical protein